MERSELNQVVGRFAPSPTGLLHIGSLATAVGSYLMAKRAGGLWLVRLDDLDSQRQVTGVAADILRTLELFGLQWDGAVACQSRNTEEYKHFFEILQASGMVYPCSCSRKEIAMSSSAPHHFDDCMPYSGKCRTGKLDNAIIRSWRVRVVEDQVSFVDRRKGIICQDLQYVSGDFVLRRGDGDFAYQLAVVVDDFLAGVNQVVRGDDLLVSTPRQIYLQRLLRFPQPEYCHLPLVLNRDGSKLSKRDNLISFQLGNLFGRENLLLHGILGFLGQKPPEELATYSCSDILQWGCEHFDLSLLPECGSALEV